MIGLVGAFVNHVKEVIKMYYVTMTDKFMSGWGRARSKINKLIFPCETYAEAEIVEANANSRSDQKHVNICVRFPYHLNKSQYYTQIKTIKEYPRWYEAGAFAK